MCVDNIAKIIYLLQYIVKATHSCLLMFIFISLLIVILPGRTNEPVYIKALIPSTEDEVDPPLNTVHSTSHLIDQSDLIESNQTSQQSNDEGDHDDNETEPMYTNPFMKPPTRPIQ